MKFGKLLEARKDSLPPNYAHNCVDYTALKTFLKSKVYLCSIKLDPKEEIQQPFAQVVKRRLGDLQQIEGDFIEQLDAEVDKASSFFEKESESIAQRPDHAELLGQMQADLDAWAICLSQLYCHYQDPQEEMTAIPDWPSQNRIYAVLRNGRSSRPPDSWPSNSV